MKNKKVILISDEKIKAKIIDLVKLSFFSNHLANLQEDYKNGIKKNLLPKITKETSITLLNDKFLL